MISDKLEDLQKALERRPNPKDFPALGFGHPGINMSVWEEAEDKWFEDFTKKFAACRVELELPVGEWLTKNAKTTYEIVRENEEARLKLSVGQRLEMKHHQDERQRPPSNPWLIHSDRKWVSVETVTALLVKVSEVKTEAVQLLGKLENWATRKHFGDFDPELVFILEKVRKVLDK